MPNPEITKLSFFLSPGLRGRAVHTGFKLAHPGPSLHSDMPMAEAAKPELFTLPSHRQLSSSTLNLH